MGKGGLTFVPIIAVIGVGIVACGSASHAPRTASGSRAPRLILSAHRGRPGSRIDVTGVNCPPLLGQRDEMIWHDSYELKHPAMEKFRRVEPLHRTGDTVSAVLKIQRSDTPGRGFLELLCGGNRANAIAYIKVQR